MVNIESLKRLTFIADITQCLSPIDFHNIEIKINTLLQDHKQVQYAFKVLDIPYSTYDLDPKASGIPDEISVDFSLKTNLKIIYLLTYVLKEIYKDKLNLYISYATQPHERQFQTYIGTYLTRAKAFTNVSRPITADKILKLDILNLERKEFEKIFPNNNYKPDGQCYYTIPSNINNVYYGNDYEDDYGSSYKKYGGYNDWSDDIIDDVFDGDPEATWNID